MMTYIYALVCPIDGQIKYVGKANDPIRRAKDHLLDFRCMDIHKATWCRMLRNKKLKPEVVILDEVDIIEWPKWEEFWCYYMKSLGYKLFNSRSGNGLTYKNHKTFQSGNTPHNKGKVRDKNGKYIIPV